MAENIYEYYLEKGRARFAGKDLNKVMDKIKDYYIFCVNNKVRSSNAKDKSAQANEYKNMLKELKAKTGAEIINEYGVQNEIYDLITESELNDDLLSILNGRNQFIDTQKVSKEIKEKNKMQLQLRIETANKVRDAVKVAMTNWQHLDDDTKLEVKTYQVVDHIETQTNTKFGEQIQESPNVSFLFANFFHSHDDAKEFVASQEKTIEEDNVTM